MTRTRPFLINGQTQYLAPQDDPRESLLRWLKRQRFHGTKEGCGDGDCGACTVAEVVTEQGERQLRALNSCLLPMGQVLGREFVTVEGLAQGQRLHPVQEAMVQTAGSQCGYCTPGFVMSLFVGYHEGKLDDHAIDGNLCRCTGYVPIRNAMAKVEHDAESVRTSALPAAVRERSANLDGPPHSAFLLPTSIDEAIAFKQQFPEFQWLAGATDSGVALSRGQTLAPGFVCLDRIPSLTTLSTHDDGYRIGAGVSLVQLERSLADALPMLADMLPWFAARQVKNRATVGGNIGSASPIGDLLPCFLALDASFELHGPDGVRHVPAHAYFLDYRKTARHPGELIAAVTIPKPSGRQRFYKVAKRQTDDISIVAGAFRIDIDEQGTVRDLRLAYGGVAAIPKRATATEQWLRGRVMDAATIAEATKRVTEEFAPLSDHRASREYRTALIGNLLHQFLTGVA
ncbi:xanthine dehydrogenase small subunit [Ahniella affigens]|uniref:Xanthine dehydrogenase small subunit n=1 Tax=Ahniella affigens TaxID=2021234 RepID=A0A2P1PT78_9GAMM|nr:FAD binding domain-containing protein [Ahniella affigens]AVP98020.1 xanthine dehydrogenase small subunit [Ahniella affigens]